MTVNINVFVVYTILFYGCLDVYADELITNGNFENDDDVTPWFCQGNCSLQLSTDSHRGNLSVNVSNR